MKERSMKTFIYNCSCGHQVKAFVDFGVPQELYKCRMCGGTMKREDH